MRALVSIVIPTYNRARDLDRCLKSVLTQTYSNWEVLVVDNHSTDNTDNVVKNFNDSRIKLFKIHNLGMIAASRNLGIQHAKGEYIAFLDSDDWWMPRKLDESLKYLEQGEDVVYHDLFTVKKSNQKLFWKRAKTDDIKSPVFDSLIIKGNVITNSSVILRKNILLISGSLPEDIVMNPASDFAAWLHVAKYTEKFKRIPKTLGYLWIGGGNVTTPERTITSLDRIKFLYMDNLPDLSKKVTWWFNYAQGRAYYRLRSYEMAKKYLKLIRWQRAPLVIKIKSFWMFLLTNLHHKKP